MEKAGGNSSCATNGFDDNNVNAIWKNSEDFPYSSVVGGLTYTTGETNGGSF